MQVGLQVFFFARCHSAAEIPGSIHRIMQAIIARLQAGCAVGQVMGFTSCLLWKPRSLLGTDFWDRFGGLRV